MATILHIDDEPAIAFTIQRALERAGHRALRAGGAVEALQLLDRETVDLVISDYMMPGVNGIELMGVLREAGHDVPVILLTGHASVEHAVAALKAGAADYITKPVSPQQLELVVDQALEMLRLRRENAALRAEVDGMRGERRIIGESRAIRRLLETAATAAPSRATVLLQGESGTGKELFARTIHERSDRRARPFVTLNCAALPEGLIESALFGHEKGAFTGALKRVEGAFERAHGGTLLLDEVSEMRLDLQAKLLRVLQEQEFERVGGQQSLRVDVRVIATTNRDLAAAAVAGTFRPDLYYRLSVIPLTIPPLRARREDILLLAHRSAQDAATELGREVTGIAPDAAELLVRYDWPGNVRELKHAVDRAVILASGPVLERHLFDGRMLGITDTGLASTLRRPPHRAEGGDAPLVVLDSLDVRAAEDACIRKALEVAGGNRTRAAALLGLSVRTLRQKLNGEGRVPSTAA